MHYAAVAVASAQGRGETVSIGHIGVFRWYRSGLYANGDIFYPAAGSVPVTSSGHGSSGTGRLSVFFRTGQLRVATMVASTRARHYDRWGRDMFDRSDLSALVGPDHRSVSTCILASALHHCIGPAGAFGLLDGDTVSPGTAAS